jgi:hypothetical protein
MLGQAAVELLLSILESSAGTISAQALRLADPDAAAALLESGALVPEGYEPTVSSIDGHDDYPVSLEGAERGGGYRYFSATSGWIDVPANELRRYRLDVRTAMAAIMPSSLKLAPTRQMELIEKTLWSIGAIGNKRLGLEILLARRLTDPKIRERVKVHLANHPTSRRRLLLTSTSSGRIASSDLLQIAVVSLPDLFPIGSGRIKTDTLLRMAASAGRATGQLWLSADGGELRISAFAPIVFRGPVQRKLIRLLVDSHRNGERLTTNYLLNMAGSESHSLPKAFGTKKWKLLKSYLTNSEGAWGFDI